MIVSQVLIVGNNYYAMSLCQSSFGGFLLWLVNFLTLTMCLIQLLVWPSVGVTCKAQYLPKKVLADILCLNNWPAKYCHSLHGVFCTVR